MIRTLTADKITFWLLCAWLGLKILSIVCTPLLPFLRPFLHVLFAAWVICWGIILWGENTIDKAK